MDWFVSWQLRDIKWCKSVKALGVHYSYNKEVSFQKKTFTTSLPKLKNKYSNGAEEVSLYLVKYELKKVFFFLNWCIYFLFSHLPRNLYH